jgi:hypothetical protein
MNARRTKGLPKQQPVQASPESVGTGPWLRMQLQPFSLLIVQHRTLGENFRYIGTRADVESLDQKTLRALATGLIGLGRTFSSRPELIDEMWRLITAGFEKAATGEGQESEPAAVGSTAPPAVEKASGDESARADLRSEIGAIRKQLDTKLAALRTLGGPKKKGGSETVDRVLSLLLGPGATKSVLVAETGAKKGYIDALLSRILPARGHSILSTRAEGAREKTYRVEAATVTPVGDGNPEAQLGGKTT